MLQSMTAHPNPTVNKFARQENLYQLPYHHLIDFPDGNLIVHRGLVWGLEYYAYVQEVISRTVALAPGQVAEVGCGDGKILYEISRRLPQAQCEGFDLSAKAILFAQAFAAGQTNLRFFQQPFKASRLLYDLIICVETLEHITDSDLPAFMKSLAEHLSPRGLLILTVPSVNIPLATKHYRHYTPSLLRSTLAPWFTSREIIFIYDYRWRSQLISLLFINPLFALRSRRLRRALLFLFKRYCLFTDERHGRHLLAVCQLNRQPDKPGSPGQIRS